jgi:hypothetical protein
MKILSEIQIEMLFGERLDSTIFTWDNYCGTKGYSLVMMYDTHHNKNENAVINDQFECRGWCYAGSLIVRSRNNGIAIMLWDKKDKEDVWCHCSDDMLETLQILWMAVNDVDEQGKSIT